MSDRMSMISCGIGNDKIRCGNVKGLISCRRNRKELRKSLSSPTSLASEVSWGYHGGRQ